MTTTTLSSKDRFLSFFGKLMKRNLAVSVYLFVFLFLAFPLQMVFETQRQLQDYNNNTWTTATTISGMYTSLSAVLVAVILGVAALVLGLLQSGYMHNKRSVDLYHSLPLTRVQLMGANMLAAFCTIAVPFLLNFMINAGVCSYRVARLGSNQGAGLPVGEMLWDLLGWLVMVLAILAVVQFIATQVGSVFENFVFSCELLLAPLAVLLLTHVLFSEFLTGFPYMINEKLYAAVSPLGMMAGRLAMENDSAYYKILILLWLLISVAILLGSMVLYRRRRSELAETPGCRGILGGLLSAVAVYLGAPIVGGLLLDSGLNLIFAVRGGGGGASRVTYVIGVAIGSILCFLLLEAILNRGFAGLRRKLPFGAAVCAVVTAVSLVITTGGLGYVSRVPVAAQVQSVQVNLRGWYETAMEVDVTTANENFFGADGKLIYLAKSGVTLSSPEAVEAVRGLHTQLYQLNHNPREDDSTITYNGTSLHYALGGSTQLKRDYTRVNGNTLQHLEAVEDTAEFQRLTNPLLRMNRSIIAGIGVYDSYGFYASDIADSRIPALMDALEKDALAHGNAPFRNNEAVLCYLYIKTPPVLFSYYVRSSEPKSTATTLPDGYFNSVSIPVFAGYSNTLAALGGSLPVPAQPGDITRIGVSSYYNSKIYSYSARGDRFVSGVTGDKNESTYSDWYTEDRPAVEWLAQNGIRAAYITSGSNGEGSSEQRMQSACYVTLYKGEKMGITMQVAVYQIPPELLDQFPELKERYGYEYFVNENTPAAEVVGVVG